MITTGLRIVPTIHLTLVGLDINVPMEIDKIEAITDVPNGDTVVNYNGTVFVVAESKVEIDDAIETVLDYKEKCVKYAKTLFGNEDGD